MPETKEELKMIAASTKEIPGSRIIAMQRNLISVLGYDPDFGVSCLNRLMKDFPNDHEVASKFQSFMMCAEFAGQ